MLHSIITVLRAFLQITLLVIFMWYFGLPAVDKFNERKVMVVTTRKATEGIAGPSITILVENPTHKNGWKEAIQGSDETDIIRSYCQGLEGDRIVDCIGKKTYTMEDGIKDALLGFTVRQSLKGEKHWKTDFTFPSQGQSYTLQIPRKLTPSYLTDQLLIEFNYSFIYTIYIHDKDFFLLNDNPYGLSMPIIKPNPTTDPTFYYYQLVLTHHQELNVPQDPCQTELGYSFQVKSCCPDIWLFPPIPGLCEREPFQQDRLQTTVGQAE